MNKKEENRRYAACKRWIENEPKPDEICEAMEILVNHTGPIELVDLNCLITGGGFNFFDFETDDNPAFIDGFMKLVGEVYTQSECK